MLSIDIYILVSALARFVLFFILHLLAIRLKRRVSFIHWLIFPFFLSLILSILVELRISSLTIDDSIVILLSIFFYCLFVIIYVLGVFGMMLASLRIRLLTLVANGNKDGASQEKILSIYNKEKILQHRLERLVQNGDLGLFKNQYFIRNRYSLFLIHGLIFELLRKLYLRKYK